MSPGDVADGGGAARIEYRLGPAAIRRRARAVALVGSLALVLPGALIAVLVAGQGVLRSGMVQITAAALLVLAGVRAAVTHQRVVRQLARFSVHLEPEVDHGVPRHLVVRAGQRTIELRPQAIESLVEIAGTLGGVRVRIADGEGLETPDQIDVPRGGEGFAELLRALLTFAPGARFEPPRRRSRGVRLARGAAVVATSFFLPFFAVDFLHRSRLLAYGLALLVFVIVRAALRPGG